jgi:hypothetical protein
MAQNAVGIVAVLMIDKVVLRMSSEEQKQSIAGRVRLYTAAKLPARIEGQLPSAILRSRNWRRV